MKYRPCGTCGDAGGQTGHHPDQPCWECGLPFMADETMYGAALIDFVKAGFARGVAAARPTKPRGKGRKR